MRYPFSYFSSTGRTLLCLLCGGVFLASCERGPTDFDEPVTSELQLKQVSLYDISQYVIAESKGILIQAPTDTMDIPLKEGEGTLIKGDAGTILKFHFESGPLTRPEFDVLERETGYSLVSLDMNLEITSGRSESSNGAHLTQHQCITDNSVLIVAKKRYWDPWNADTLAYPIVATIDSLVEETNDNDESIVTANIQIHAFLRTGSSPSDIFTYDCQAKIRIE